MNPKILKKRKKRLLSTKKEQSIKDKLMKTNKKKVME